MAAIRAVCQSDQDVVDLVRRAAIREVDRQTRFGDSIQITFTPHNCRNTPDKRLIEFIEPALQFVKMLRFGLLLPSAPRVRLSLFDEL
jgi:hypothetical protein